MGRPLNGPESMARAASPPPMGRHTGKELPGAGDGRALCWPPCTDRRARAGGGRAKAVDRRIYHDGPPPGGPWRVKGTRAARGGSTPEVSVSPSTLTSEPRADDLERRLHERPDQFRVLTG